MHSNLNYHLPRLAFVASLAMIAAMPGCKSGGTATTGPTGNGTTLASKSTDPLLNSGGAHADPARATANRAGYEAKGQTTESSPAKKD